MIAFAGCITLQGSDNRYDVKPRCSDNGDGQAVAFVATLGSVGKSSELARWVQAAADAVGGQAALATALTSRMRRAYDRSMVQKMTSGARRVAADEMLAIETISGIVAPSRKISVAVQGLPLLGKATAGAWREVSKQVEPDLRPIAADPRYPQEAQFLLEVDGASLNRIAGHGALLTCVDLEKSGLEARPGDLVVVERTRGKLVETSVRRLTEVADGLELWPESNDPRHQERLPVKPARATGLQIQAIVIWVTSPIPRGD